MRQVFSLPGWSILHVAGVFPSGMEHFCMRQVRGGEAFVVAKAILPSSRSSPPGHAAVLRCGMCCFVGGAMDSTLLDVVGCADMSGCSTKSTHSISAFHHFPPRQPVILCQKPGNRPATRAAFPSDPTHRLSLTASTA